MPRKNRAQLDAEGRARIDAARKAKPARRGKRRDDIAGTDALTREPTLTEHYAMEFVKLLNAGIPSTVVLSYFAPEHFESLNTKQRSEWLHRWQRDPLMAEAATAYNKGVWQDLDKDTRLQIALDKHMAELAYFLYTENYARAEGFHLAKIKDARTAIVEYMKAGEGDADTPMMRALKDLLEGKLSAGGPPQLDETIPIEQTKKGRAH